MGGTPARLTVQSVVMGSGVKTGRVFFGPFSPGEQYDGVRVLAGTGATSSAIHLAPLRRRPDDSDAAYASPDAFTSQVVPSGFTLPGTIFPGLSSAPMEFDFAAPYFVAADGFRYLGVRFEITGGLGWTATVSLLQRPVPFIRPPRDANRPKKTCRTWLPYCKPGEVLPAVGGPRGRRGKGLAGAKGVGGDKAVAGPLAAAGGPVAGPVAQAPLHRQTQSGWETGYYQADGSILWQPDTSGFGYGGSTTLSSANDVVNYVRGHR